MTRKSLSLFGRANSLAAVAALLLLLCAGPASAGTGTPLPPHCPPTSPDEVGHDLNAAIDNLTSPTRVPYVCASWKDWNSPVFGEWDGGGGSLNLPVASAAVGLYRFRNDIMQWTTSRRRRPNPSNYQITYVDWWIWFLASQTGQDPKAYLPNHSGMPDRVNLRYFRGTEEFSNIYDSSVVTNVAAVRYWAVLNRNSPDIPGGKAQQLIDLTKRFLLASFAVYGLAASDHRPVWTYEVPGRTPAPPGTKPAPDTQYDPGAPHKGSTYVYDGSFVALAGARSGLGGHWTFDYRAQLYDRALGEFGTQLMLMHPPMLPFVLNKPEAKWNQLDPSLRPAGENLYGLTQGDKDNLRAVRRTGSAAAVSYVMRWLDNIRTSTTYHFIARDGWRASAMEVNTNGNTPNIYATAYWASDPNDPAHAKATFLFPWTDNGGAGAAGWCKIESGQISAGHEDVWRPSKDPRQPPRLVHPAMTVSMPVPTSTFLYHIILSPDADPRLESQAPNKSSVIPPPVFTPGETAFGGDSPWLFNTVPEGAAAYGYNEGWDWVDTEPQPLSEALYVRQSALINGDRHQHFFTGAADALPVNAGESLYAYVYLDSANPPTEVMLQWEVGGGDWDHRVYWGADRITDWGTNGTASRLYMGPLPPAGQWARLEVPAKFVGLEGAMLTGMAFTLFDGRAYWDTAGKNIHGMYTNLAAGAAATQSSTWGGIPASNAVDGSTSGNYFSHTNYDYQAWWQVDLGASYYIDQVNVWNRTDCCAERLSDFDVMVSDAPFNGTAPVYSVRVAGQAGRPSTVNMGRKGRYVRVQLSGTNYLSLSEVEVFGADLPAPPGPAAPAPAISISDVSVAEGNAGTVNAVFTVALSAASAGSVSANYATANGSAAAGSDFTAVSGALTFSPGQTSKTLSVPVTGDTVVEGNETFFVNLSAPAGATLADGQGQGTIINDDAAAPPTSPGEIVWTDDAFPAGAASTGNESWSWTGASGYPTPLSGTNAHRSGYAAGSHQHYFYGATGASALTPGPDDVLFAYVFLDPMNPPSEVMLQWIDSYSWEHRAYWGANLIPYGTDGTNSRRYVGPLPPAGRWVRLEVPASAVGLGGVTLQGMAFTLYGGVATWDYAGKAPNDYVWVEDSVPYGAAPVSEPESWSWVDAQSPAPFSGRWAHQSALLTGMHQHYFVGATDTMTVGTGEKLFAYVYLDPSQPPSEVMLQWDDGSGSWAHRAYWGGNLIAFGLDGSASRYYMGPLPPAGRWVRLEVPASAVRLQGVTLRGMAFTLYGGRATWDRAGKAP